MKITCKYFKWTLYKRDGKYYANGRSNRPNAGRHSLGTRNLKEAEELVVLLDQKRAEDLKLTTPAPRKHNRLDRLPIAEGRALYEARLALPVIAGGVQPSTRKRYRAAFDKFSEFAGDIGLTNWDDVVKQVLEQYAAYLTSKEYAPRTIFSELVIIKQTQHWLVDEEYLGDCKPVRFRMPRPQSQPAYCWRPEEVAAILAYCRERPELEWLHDVLLTLACTGLRISEAIGLRWTDIDLDQGLLSLSDESGFSASVNDRRRLKGGRSRTLVLHQDLQSLLRTKTRHGRFIFAGPRGGRLKADTVRRILVREVLTPLADRFPSPEGIRGFRDGRLHSFRHYFCSMSANGGVPEPVIMDWLGHSDSAMVRVYYHLHNDESRRHMASINFTGASPGLSGGGQSTLEP